MGFLHFFEPKMQTTLSVPNFLIVLAQLDIEWIGFKIA